MTDTQERMDAAAIDWVRRIPLDQIPRLLAFLSARLLAERGPTAVASTTAKARAMRRIS
jgi:hypothetical protein